MDHTMHNVYFYPNCFSCHAPMLECSRKDLRDTLGWKCSSCKTSRSVRGGHFFARSQLTLQQMAHVTALLVDTKPCTL